MIYTCILISPEGVDVQWHSVRAVDRREALLMAQKHFGIETDELGYSNTGWAIDVMLEEP